MTPKITVKGTRSVNFTTTAMNITPNTTFESNTIINVDDTLTPNELVNNILNFISGVDINNYYTIISNTANTITVAGSVDLGALNETFEVYVPNVKIYPTTGTILFLNGIWTFNDVVIGNDVDEIVFGDKSVAFIKSSIININIKGLQDSNIHLTGCFLYTLLNSQYSATWSLINCIIDEITELQIWDSTITMMGCYIFNTSLIFQNCNINIQSSELSAGVYIVLTQICHLILDNCILAYDLITTDTISCSNSRLTLLNNITFIGNVVNAISLVNNSTAIVSDSVVLQMDVINGNAIHLDTYSNLIFGSGTTFNVNSPGALESIIIARNKSSIVANQCVLNWTPSSITEYIMILEYGSTCDLILDIADIIPTTTAGGFLIKDNSNLLITSNLLNINNLLGVNIFTVSNNSKLSIYNPSGGICNIILNSDQILFDASFNSQIFIDSITFIPPPVIPLNLIAIFNIHYGSTLTITSVAGINTSIPAFYNPTDTYILGGLVPSGTIPIPGNYLNDFAAGTPEGCSLITQP